MNKLFLSFTLLMSLSVFAQDLIIKKDQTEVKAKVIELTDELIKYNKYEMLDGPIYSIKNSEVFMIVYKNGTKEYISQKTNPTNVPVPQTAVGNVTNTQPASNPVDLKSSSKTTDKTKVKPKNFIFASASYHFLTTPNSNIFDAGMEGVFFDEICIGPRFTFGYNASDDEPIADLGIVALGKFEFGDNFYTYLGFTYSIDTSKWFVTPRIDWYFLGDFGVNAVVHYDTFSVGLVYRGR